MEEKILSPFSFFAENQETYEEAVKKSAEESSSFARTKHFRIDSVGTYPVRILPLAPVKDTEGNWTMERKGYEYPIRTQVLKLENPKSTSKKDKFFFVNVCHSSYAGISADLIDTYIKVAEEKYGNDEKLIKKIKSTGFEGGLKWNSQRMMYVFDMNKRGEGIQLLTLSYSQYKDLEERKLAVWKKLLEKEPKCPCPISSINQAYPVEITRKEENGKTTYSFNIDILSGTDQLNEEELQALLDTPRIPDTQYRYSRFHFEATVEYLKQYDTKMEMDVMSSKEIADTIAKIGLEIPTEDKSHFSFDKRDRNNDANGEDSDSIDALWNRWEKLNERGIGDKSDEGQELRDAIRTFIDNNELNVRVTRNKTNEDLLLDIEDALEVAKDNDTTEEDEDEAVDVASEQDNNEVEGEEDSQNNNDPEEDEDSARSHSRRRGEHNDDTNEPAVRNNRRCARPERRRR